MNRPSATRNALLPSAARLRIAVVVSQFHEHLTDRLVRGALETLRRHGSAIRPADVVRVPGAFELPQAANLLARTGRWDAIICLGVVIKGETPHFDFVAGEAARGIQQVALERRLPVVFGVLTTNTERQALERAGGKHGHKGIDAALTAIHMAHLYRRHRTVRGRRR